MFIFYYFFPFLSQGLFSTFYLYSFVLDQNLIYVLPSHISFMFTCACSRSSFYFLPPCSESSLEFVRACPYSSYSLLRACSKKIIHVLLCLLTHACYCCCFFFLSRTSLSSLVLRGEFMFFRHLSVFIMYSVACSLFYSILNDSNDKSKRK